MGGSKLVPEGDPRLGEVSAESGCLPLPLGLPVVGGSVLAADAVESVFYARSGARAGDRLGVVGPRTSSAQPASSFGRRSIVYRVPRCASWQDCRDPVEHASDSIHTALRDWPGSFREQTANRDVAFNFDSS